MKLGGCGDCGGGNDYNVTVYEYSSDESLVPTNKFTPSVVFISLSYLVVVSGTMKPTERGMKHVLMSESGDI